MATHAAVREQVRRIRRRIPKAQKLADLLEYLVEESLAGRQVTLQSVGEGFFGYTPEELKPELEAGKDNRPSHPRVYLRNLRRRLIEYYADADSNDFVHISLVGEGNYNPVIQARFEEISAGDRAKLRRANERRELRTAAGFEEGIGLLEQVIAEYPEHPVVCARLAEFHSLRVMHAVVSPRPDLEKALQYAQIALAKSKRVWEAYAGLGGVYACLDWNWKKAENAFEDALDITGLRFKSLPWYRAFLASQGRFPELIEDLEHVITDLADIGAPLRRNLGIALMFAGDFEQALYHLESAIPHHTAHLYMGMIHAACGEYEKALEQARLARARPGSEYVVPGFLVFALAQAGKRDEAEAELAKIRAASHYFSCFHTAVAHLGLGETERAMDYLEAASDEREFFVLWLSCWPTFRALHGHPRFEALRKRIGLPKPT
jgi:tetratricopeptide (TPR) repeat protein